MEYVLDNPVWNALISGNKDLAIGTEKIKYFDKDVSPFVGVFENNPECLQKLQTIIPRTTPIILVTAEKLVLPGSWKLLNQISCFQMICNNPPGVELDEDIRPLTIENVRQMLTLTKLTNPGPFNKRTWEFGHYHGIFAGDELIAMAGQRMKINQYAEISAVCTHPQHLGNGYARALLLFHINRINQANEVPILHVRKDNHRAISVYKSIGFETRCLLHFYVLQKT